MPIDWLTDDGYDMTFGVNVVGTELVILANSLLNRATAGHFLFTQLLVPALTAGKETSPDRHSRIIWLSSFGSYMSTIPECDCWCNRQPVLHYHVPMVRP